MINIIISHILRSYNSEYIHDAILCWKSESQDFFQKVLKKLLMLYFFLEKISLS